LSLPELGFDTVVVRFGGEIGIKAEWTRKLYERRLITNIKATLKHHTISYTGFIKKFGRLYIKTTQAQETAEKLSKVLGITSLSPALETTSNLKNILNVGVHLAKLRFKKGKSFAVLCRRVGKHLYTSQDVCRQVGHSILTQLPQLNLRVDLSHPKQVLHIEVREDKAYVFTDTIKGVAGLPLGTQPKVVCLLKGDISSTVACWMTMKRGCPPILVYFENGAFGKKLGIKRVIDTAQRLMDWSTGFPRKLCIVEYSQSSQRIAHKCPLELRDFLCKRMMLRIAQHIAVKESAEGIVTGDTLGKKATQTLHAFRIQDEAVREYPVHRPLIGLDTKDIKEIAQRISLEKTNLREVKNKKAIKKTQTTAINLEDIKQIEKEQSIEQIAEDALKSINILKF